MDALDEILKLNIIIFASSGNVEMKLDVKINRIDSTEKEFEINFDTLRSVVVIKNEIPNFRSFKIPNINRNSCISSC